MRDEYGNEIAGSIANEISNPRRGGVRTDVDYGFIFLDNRLEVDEYFRLRREHRKKEAAEYLNRCLVKSEHRRLRGKSRSRKTKLSSETNLQSPKNALSTLLHSLVDTFMQDDCSGFLTEEDIDRAITVLKELSNTRMTYREAARELGCSVPALRTKICRSKIKPEHTVYLRRKDVEKLKRNAEL